MGLSHLIWFNPLGNTARFVVVCMFCSRHYWNTDLIYENGFGISSKPFHPILVILDSNLNPRFALSGMDISKFADVRSTFR